MTTEYSRKRPGILRGFLNAESGGMTIEALLWMPIFAGLLCIVADASVIFGRKAEVLRIVQDANRGMSIGRFRQVQDAENYILARINGFAPHAVADTNVVSGVITTVVTMPATDLTVKLPFGLLDTMVIRVSAEHMAEA